ncbi:MAG: glutathione S-transferase family protein [Gammaproteobacteria bacterium]|nr:glutathione S-transferase family protein [Gammaproteobacteria bacterium]
MMNKPTLYGIFASPYVRKTCLVLAYKGIVYEHLQLPPQNDDPGFREASPLGKIPAWRDEHTAFSDSSVIIQYLERFYPGPSLLPESPGGFARALWFEEYADSKLVPIFGGHLFAEEVLAERIFKRPALQSDIDKALNEEIPVVATFLESQIKGRQFLVGDSLTLADIAVGGVLLLLYHTGRTIDRGIAPELASYLERLYQSETFAGVIRSDVAGLQQLGWESPM